MARITMGERMVKLETEMIDLKDRNTDEHKALNDKITKFIESADKKYASKVFEKISVAVIILFAAALITKFFGLW